MRAFASTSTNKYHIIYKEISKVLSKDLQHRSHICTVLMLPCLQWYQHLEIECATRIKNAQLQHTGPLIKGGELKLYQVGSFSHALPKMVLPLI